MEIYINNKARIVEHHESVTMQHLLDLEIQGRQLGIAVAVNNTIVPRAEWSDYRIHPNDKILIIQATQGG